MGKDLEREKKTTVAYGNKGAWRSTPVVHIVLESCVLNT